MPEPSTHAIMDAVPTACFLLDSDGRITHVNPMARSILGTAVLNRYYVTALRQPGILASIETAIERRQPQSGTYSANTHGTEIQYLVSAVPIGDDPDAGILVSLEDVSQLHTAGRMRRDFVANVSHELRTPLTAMIGFVETLTGPARQDPEASGRFLEMMMKEAQRMNRLVGDLLSLSSVEASERLRPSDEISLWQVLQASIASLAQTADAAQVAVDITGSDKDMNVRGDRDQLRQLFNNLVENAVKYGGDGGSVRIVLHDPQKDATLRCLAVRIDVRDSGQGIDPIHLPRLTERFYRIDDHRSRVMGGTGLGLAIVKHIVNRHRGRMEIDSRIGDG